MIAPDSSSSATNPLLELDLLESGRLAPLPSAFLRGEDRDLLLPLKFLDPGSLPTESGEARGAPAGGPARTPDSKGTRAQTHSGPSSDSPALGADSVSAGVPASRAALAAAMGEANGAYGHPRARELAQRLADPRTAVVVSGQQPGLWGGPLLAVVKALAAVKYAAALEAQGVPAVAIFWVATEDHDWAEATSASVPGRQEVLHVDLGDDPQPLLPLSERRWGAGTAEAHAQVSALLGGGPTLERWQAEVETIFGADEKIGDAFCRLFVKMLGEQAPLLLDAALPALKEAEKPFLRRLIEQRFELDAAYAAAEAKVLARGHQLQVNPQREVSPLFLVRAGERRRIEFPSKETFALRGVEGSEAPIEELLRLIDDSPASVSPGVLARPAIQDAVLGTTLQVMGPAELSYLVQAAPAYEILGIVAPATTLRPQALLLEDRQVSWLEELDLPLAELMSQPIETALTSRLGGNVVEAVRRQVTQAIEALRQPLLDLDGSLEAPWRKSSEQIDRTLEQLEAKTTSAAARRHEVQFRRLEQLRQAILPDDHLQERAIVAGYFYARFGEALVPALYEGLDLGARRLSVIRLSAAGKA